jgi:sugar transferase (PEP-CTERM system associated)
MMSSYRSRALCIIALEGMLICICSVLAIWMKFGSQSDAVLTTFATWWKILFLMAVVQASFYIFDLYDLQLIRDHSTLSLRICQGVGLASITLAAAFRASPQLMLGRGAFMASLLLMLGVIVWWRLAVLWLLGHPKLSERVLIIGSGRTAIDLAREALERPESGYRVVGFVGDDPRLIGRSLINPAVVGIVSDLENVIRRHQPDRIVVAMGNRRGRLPLESLLQIKLRGDAAVEEAASFHERLTWKVSTDLLRPSWLIFSNGPRRLGIYRRVRTIGDVAISFLALVLSLPLMALVAIAIKLDSRGPVVYTQERVGLHGRSFRIIKFRSMFVDAEKDGPVWAGESDPRITRVGRIIRKLRLDELPQFINILRGEMSFIGPRPERPVFVEYLGREIAYYSQRHLVKPGLTGWAQIRRPYGASLEDAREKLQYDLYYIKNQSPVLDAIILIETIRIVLFGRGAR